MESKVLKMRDNHPAWGARKIGVRLKVLGEIGVPVDSTIHEILRRHDRIDPQESRLVGGPGRLPLAREAVDSQRREGCPPQLPTIAVVLPVNPRVPVPGDRHPS